MELFKKSSIIGVAITPERGLEIAEINFLTKEVIKYGVRSLEFDIHQRAIADLDIFKETLQDLLLELQIPKNSPLVLCTPTVAFKVNDYPAALDDGQISNAIEEELAENPFFKNTDPSISAAMLPNSSMQFNKVAYVASQKVMLIEIAMIIKELGYKIHAIETSVNATLNTLMYKEQINVSDDSNWVMLIIENYCCRLILMNGKNYVDAFEERVVIGEVLGDDENYSAVVSAIDPLLKNLPSKYLYIVSKTDLINAEIVASKISYSARIIHLNANRYSLEKDLSFAPTVDEAVAGFISMDVIGAAIYREFMPYASACFNLYNKSLGDIYILEQPPEINFRGKNIVLSNENLIKIFIVIAILVIIPSVIGFSIVSKYVSDLNSKGQELDSKITQIQKFLKENENVSSDLFDEGDEIKVGLVHNKNIYSYYTIVGTEIPKKLWLTHLNFNDKVTIEGQADNLESVYAFFRSLKDYNPDSKIELQELSLASNSAPLEINNDEDLEVDSVLTSLNADFYQFKISNAPKEVKNKNGKDKNGKDDKKGVGNLPDLETIKE